MGLDPNIFFRGAELQANNAARTQATIGNFFDKLSATKQKQLDLEKAKETDYEGSAYRVIMAQKAGVEPDPADLIRAQAWDVMNTSQNAINPATGEAFPKNTSIFGNLQASPGPNYQGSYAPPMMSTPGIVPDADMKRMQGMTPALNMPTGANRPVADDIGLGNVNDMVMPPLGDNYKEVRGMSAPSLPTPSNQKQELINFEAQTNIAAEGEKKKAALQAEKNFNAPQAKAKIAQSIAELKNVDDTIGKAIKQTSKWTAGTGSVLSNLPGTDAKNLEATLNTIKADSAFSALQTMRDNSPTGGALGSIAVQELKLLESAQAALDQAQTADQLRENLQKYQNLRRGALTRAAKAYEETYGEKINLPAFDQAKSSAVSYEDYFK